jgi:hypothetical protein
MLARLQDARGLRIIAASNANDTWKDRNEARYRDCSGIGCLDREPGLRRQHRRRVGEHQAAGADIEAGAGRREDDRALDARFHEPELRAAAALPRHHPGGKKLLAAARAAKATVVYSIIANSTPADVIKDVAPEANEPHVRSGSDKFLKTDLEKIMKDKGIQTVIAVGTSSNGAVLFTAAGAAFRGMNVVVPVDGMSAADPLAEYATVLDVQTAPQLSTRAC